MLALQIAAGLLMAAFVVLACIKGLAIHRANEGWRGAFGAGLFIAAFTIGGLFVVAGVLVDYGPN